MNVNVNQVIQVIKTTILECCLNRCELSSKNLYVEWFLLYCLSKCFQTKKGKQKMLKNGFKKLVKGRIYLGSASYFDTNNEIITLIQDCKKSALPVLESNQLLVPGTNFFMQPCTHVIHDVIVGGKNRLLESCHNGEKNISVITSRVS